MIRNIVFDMGNVLVRFDPPHFLDRAGIQDAEDRAVILRELFQSVEWALMDRGLLTEETAEPLILPRVPERLRPAVRHLLYHWADQREEMPGMRRIVEELKASGYALYLLSNASLAHHQYGPRFPVSSCFDGVLISADLRLIKPMDEIYTAFLRQFQLRAEECVFIDDLPVNVAGAVAGGWKGLVYRGDPDRLREELRALEIDI